MIRISDILKKAKESRKAEDKSWPEVSLSNPLDRPIPQRVRTPPAENPVALQQTPLAQQQEVRKTQIKKEEAKPADIRISSILNKPVSGEEGEALYQEMALLAQELLVEKNAWTADEIKRLVEAVERAIEQLMVANVKLLMSAFSRDSLDVNSQYYHALNVCIYAIEIGLEFKYSRLNVLELGVLAFLHDTPPAKYLLAASPESAPNETVKEEPQKYAAVISQIFSCIDGLGNLPGDILRHESGLSEGVERFISAKNEMFTRYARIIAVADFYETMTHKGIYGDRRSSLEAVQEILNNKDKYEPGVIKVLIDRIGIFPVGSIISLSTREMAQVIRLNKGKPLRPIIKILYDTEGKKLQAEKILDLSMHPTIYIKEEEKAVNPVRKDAA